MAVLTVKQAKAVAERYQKAVELVEQNKVLPLVGRPNEFVVLNGQAAYWVQVAGDESWCDCPDFRYRRHEVGACKHLWAAMIYTEGAGGNNPQPPAADEPVDGQEWEAAADQLAADAPRGSYCMGCGSPISYGPLCTQCESSARSLLADLL